MKKIVLITWMIVQTIAAYSQTDTYGDSTTYQSDGKWIDETLEQCIKQKGSTNNGVVACLVEALDAWEKQLHDTYELLYSQMEGANRINLQSSQTAWEAYKKAQYRFLENYYGSMEGTMYKQIMVSEKIDVLKRRFPELYNLTQD
ncbi:MAG: DUF1311 domain-containing protein [Bacteroidetes bacterium]|nr:DUF1311 domain-containing protein [Bacteroidota bacterium]